MADIPADGTIIASVWLINAAQTCKRRIYVRRQDRGWACFQRSEKKFAGPGRDYYGETRRLVRFQRARTTVHATQGIVRRHLDNGWTPLVSPLEALAGAADDDAMFDLNPDEACPAWIHQIPEVTHANI